MKKVILKSLITIFFLFACLLIIQAQANPGDIWLDPLANTVSPGNNFVTSLYVNSGSQKVLSLSVKITYNPSLIEIDFSRGENGITPGSPLDVDRYSPGQILINGYYNTPKKSGPRVQLLTIYWKAKKQGVSKFNADINYLSGDNGNSIGTPTWKNSYINVNKLEREQIMNVTPLKQGIAAKDNATGRGFIMYSQKSVFTRFAGNKPHKDNAEHFICVIYDGKEWKYDNNKNYFPFTPEPNDTLVAEVNFITDEIINLAGVYDKLGGIHFGYSYGDLTFEPDRFAGKFNNGEFSVSGSYFVLPIFTDKFDNNIFGIDEDTSEAYIMYSKESVHSRFSSNPPGHVNSDHFICVRYNNGNWEYDNDINFYRFDPVSSDLLIAKVDYENDTVRSFQGKCKYINGILAGYIGGDLEFHVNLTYQNINEDDFCIKGTYFIPPREITPIRFGIAAQDNAVGEGYLMYTAENVFSRFSNNPPHKNNAFHLIAVKLINNRWHYDNNEEYVPFEIQDTDVLLAKLDFSNNIISSFRNHTGKVNGINVGYKDSNLGYFADKWNNSNNNGEFFLLGKYISLYFPYTNAPLKAPDPSYIKSVKSNSQVKLPKNMYLADVDGDNNTDFIQIAGNRLFAFKTNKKKTGLLHGYLTKNIEELYTGDFAGLGYDQIIARLEDDSYRYLCADLDQNEWYVKKDLGYNIFGPTNLKIVVGDYFGNRRDELLSYNSNVGVLKIFELNNIDMSFKRKYFAYQSVITGSSDSNSQVRAGDFNGDLKTDILLHTPSGKLQVILSDKANGMFKFTNYFSTSNNFVNITESVSTARIDGDIKDDIIIHDLGNGAIKFYKALYNNNSLVEITNVLEGDLPNIPNSPMYWIWNKGESRDHVYIRNDNLVYDRNTEKFISNHAGWNGSNYTYWSFYINKSSNYHLGWRNPEFYNWIVIKGKIDGINRLVSDEKFEDLFFGYENVNKYFRDISYGSSLSTVKVEPEWHELDITFSEWEAFGDKRYLKVNKVIDVSGIDITSYFGPIVVTNLNDSGAAAGGVLTHHNRFSNTFIAHEMAHNYGYDHSYSDDMSGSTKDPGVYGDEWDIMSAENVHRFYTAEGVQSGPEMNAPYKLQKSWIPSNRIFKVQLGSGLNKKTLNVAPINRPEVRGKLNVIIRVDEDRYFSIEYRQKTGWDRGIPRSAVLIHEVKKVDNEYRSYLIETKGNGAEWTPGETYTNDENLTITVDELDDTENRAVVTIKY